MPTKKNSVLNMLSHDLRGPLGIVKMVSQVLRKEVKEERLQDFSKTVTKAVQQCIDIVEDLLSREFLDSTGVEFVKKRIDISKKLSEYFEEYRNSEWTSQIHFNYSASHENIFIRLDESKFMQVINNLMTNALKFTRESGTIQLLVEQREDSVLFTFQDDGIGIPERLQKSLFDKFTEARRKGLNGEPTTGLGLSIVKTIIEWHGGKIWCESREGEGTTFKFKLPLN